MTATGFARSRTSAPTPAITSFRGMWRAPSIPPGLPLVLLATVDELDVAERLVDTLDGAEVCHRTDASSGSGERFSRSSHVRRPHARRVEQHEPDLVHLRVAVRTAFTATRAASSSG